MSAPDIPYKVRREIQRTLADKLAGEVDLVGVGRFKRHCGIVLRRVSDKRERMFPVTLSLFDGPSSRASRNFVTQIAHWARG